MRMKMKKYCRLQNLMNFLFYNSSQKPSARNGAGSVQGQTKKEFIRREVVLLEKRLMNIQELCDYTGWGKTKVREILKRPDSTFTIRMGNRLYADKVLFDKYIEKCAKYQIPI